MSSSALPRLSNKTLRHRQAGIDAPSYDRGTLRPGIVHLGLGAFFRAHGAVYTEDAIARGEAGWAIVGVSLQRPDQRDRLVPQDGLYSLLESSDQGRSIRVVGAIMNVLVAPEQPEFAVALLAGRDTRVVSLTITEKGYCHDPATGKLNQDHPDIRHDLENPDRPRTAVGLIVAAMAQRRAFGLAPPTVLCCDNLAHNGKLVGGLVRDFAALRDERLANWIERNGAFPSTMVDRIVPAITEADITRAEEMLGLHDAAPVSHEPFKQWVIEDTFVENRRPSWHEVGAEMVTDVAPFEAMKLRLLNASHSALAYLGYLGGHETIADCAHDAVYRAYVESLWQDEIIPVSPPPPGQDLYAYTRALLARYGNRAIRHRTWQIAMDGSQKLPQRLLGTVRDRRERGLPLPRLALAIAGWMIYVGGRDLAGNAIDVRDPLATTLRARHTDAGDDPRRIVSALLAETRIFGEDLGCDPVFASAVLTAYQAIRTHGARGAIRVLEGHSE